MSINEVLYILLTTESTITNIVGTKVYHDHLPATYTFPAIVFKTRLIDTVRTLDSVVIAEDHLATVTCFASDPVDCFNLSQVVTGFLMYYKGNYDITDIQLERDTQPYEYATKDYAQINEFTISKML